LVNRKVAVIAALGGEPSPQIAQQATLTIPIVFASNGDPVREGLVASLNRPGGNVTGVTIFGIDAVAKRMQLLREVAPKAALIGFLMNPNNPNGEIETKAAQAAASSLGKELLVFRASSEGEIDAAFATMAQQGADALLGATDTFLFGRRKKIVLLAAHYRIPAIYYLPEFAEWWSHGVRQQDYGSVPPGGYLRRANSQRREACRSTGCAGERVRICD
jgi:putative ABC transport system substrate-binding protein